MNQRYFNLEFAIDGSLTPCEDSQLIEEAVSQGELLLTLDDMKNETWQQTDDQW
jgi:hypothetical protein